VIEEREGVVGSPATPSPAFKNWTRAWNSDPGWAQADPIY
jgi:hypothetical protein